MTNETTTTIKTEAMKACEYLSNSFLEAAKSLATVANGKAFDSVCDHNVFQLFCDCSVLILGARGTIMINALSITTELMARIRKILNKIDTVTDCLDDQLMMMIGKLSDLGSIVASIY